MKITSKVVKDTATPAFKLILDNVKNPRGLMAKIGARIVNDLRAHFDRKELLPPTRTGWPKGHLWARIAKGTGIRSLDAKQVTVGIGGADAGPIFLKRLNGGTIFPKEKKALAIPVHPMAAGKYPSANLIPGVFLIKNSGVLAIKQGDGILALWVLRKSVSHPKDPTALPPDGVLQRGVMETINRYVEQHSK